MTMDASMFLQKELSRLRLENEVLKEEVHMLRDFVHGVDQLYSHTRDYQTDKALFPFLKELLTMAMKLLNAPDGSLLLYDEPAKKLEFVLVQGTLANNLIGFRIPSDRGIAGSVIETGKAQLVRDVRHDNRFSQTVDQTFSFRTQSIAAVPLMSNNRIYGLVEVLNQPGDEPFSDADLSLLKLYCQVAGNALAYIDQLKISGEKPTE
ncbi:hypothetical protein MASR2M15_07200 [Anaerolineales bacterium]